MSDAGKAAQSAREVVAKHLEALEEWFSPDSPEEVERNVERRTEARDVCRTALALRALLAQPPSDTLARLVEAAGEVVETGAALRLREGLPARSSEEHAAYQDKYEHTGRAGKHTRAVGALEAALAAHRASVDALFPGLLPETIARVNAALDAERAKTEAMKRQRDEAHNERDVLSAMLRESRAERESTRDALGAGPVEHVVDAAKRVMAELEEVRKRAAQFEAELDEAWEATGVSSTVRGMTDLADVVRSDKRSAKFVREERDDLRVALNEATRQRDEARREAARDREADRRMLKNRDEALDYAAEERDALKAEVQRLRADALNVGGDAVRKAYDLCHAALDAAKAPKVGSSGSCAERIAALAAERDEARRERDALKVEVGWRRKIEQENREVSDVVKPLGSESIMDAIKRTVAERDEARKERDAAFARRDEAAASLSRSDGLLRIAERERDEARKQRDEARWERDQSRWVGRSAAACVERDNGTQPSPAPLDPRALAIYEGAVRVWAAIPRANGFSVTDQVFEAAEILRAAESEARKGVGR